jgi:hypothetical protein
VTKALTMRQRGAGQAAIEELLSHQRNARRPSSVARFFGRSPLEAESAALFALAQGELAAGELLERLPPEWAVLHSVPTGIAVTGTAATGTAGNGTAANGTAAEGTESGVLSHVVVGPGGVFAISSRLHENQKIWVADTVLLADGYRHTHLSHVESQAQRVAGVLQRRMPLPPPVRPVLAIVDSRSITIRERSHVMVVDAWKLRRRLTEMPAVLEPSEVTEVRAILEDPASWSMPGTTPLTSGSPVAAGTPLRAEFDALATEVRVAHARRRGWRLAAYSVVVLSAVLALPYVVDGVRSLFEQ